MTKNRVAGVAWVFVAVLAAVLVPSSSGAGAYCVSKSCKDAKCNCPVHGGRAGSGDARWCASSKRNCEGNCDGQYCIPADVVPTCKAGEYLSWSKTKCLAQIKCGKGERFVPQS